MRGASSARHRSSRLNQPPGCRAKPEPARIRHDRTNQTTTRTDASKMTDDNGLVLNEIDPASIRRVHLVGVGGTGMGSFAGMLKAAGYEVTGSDENVYPPMSDMLDAWGIQALTPYRRGQPRRGEARPRHHRQRHPPGEPRGHRRARARLPQMSFPAALGALFLDRAALASWSPARTARRPPSSLMAHVLVEAGTDPSFLVGGVTAELLGQLPAGQGPALRRRGRRVRHRLLRQGPQVPPLPAADGHPHQRRVRPRRHLPRPAALRGRRSSKFVRADSGGRRGSSVCAAYPNAVALAQALARAQVVTYAGEGVADGRLHAAQRALRARGRALRGAWSAGTCWASVLLPMSGHAQRGERAGRHRARRAALGLSLRGDRARASPPSAA